MDSKTMGLIYGFVDNFTKAAIKSETHTGTQWELAEGTKLVFDAFGTGEEATATVIYVLKREGEKMNWTIEIGDSENVPHTQVLKASDVTHPGLIGKRVIAD